MPRLHSAPLCSTASVTGLVLCAIASKRKLDEVQLNVKFTMKGTTPLHLTRATLVCEWRWPRVGGRVLFAIAISRSLHEMASRSTYIRVKAFRLSRNSSATVAVFGRGHRSPRTPRCTCMRVLCEARHPGGYTPLRFAPPPR